MGFKALVFVVACVFGVFQCSIACTVEEQEKCKLPDCLCPSLDIPGGLTREQTPQIVYLTFDDAVNVVNFPIYQEILANRKNPNEHNITLSFYVTHEYNDYSFVHELWRLGHDISLHSITHKTDTQYWKDLDGEGWRKEVGGQKEQLAHFAKIPKEDIKGFRAPFLQTGGDVMMKELVGILEYDCSRPTQRWVNPGLWPYTMDFDTTFHDCEIQPCATDAYPGFWNVPMVDMTGGNGLPCAMIDTCLPQTNTTGQTLDLIKRNFLRHYEGNRAPFGVFTHAAWLSELYPGHKEGYLAFLDYLDDLDDVYIVSVPRALEWIKNPTPLEKIKTFAPWHVEEKPNACTNKISCPFKIEDTPGFPSERYMTSCNGCPRKYPWIDNPLGDSFRANKFDRH